MYIWVFLELSPESLGLSKGLPRLWAKVKPGLITWNRLL